LPVVDYHNRFIGLENILSFGVNKAIQRSFAKPFAGHGLELYAYQTKAYLQFRLKRFHIQNQKI
jgi:hypothetical protein